jgi:LysM repeat protein
MINVLIIAGAAFFHPPVVLDSIGTETINGKVFVLHQVGEKETLYAISRRYSVPVETIVQYNPAANAGLDIGQILKVPYVPRRAAKAPTGTTHVVAAKETMFSISQAYNVSVDEIREWNNLTSNALSIGQELIIKKPAGAVKPASTGTVTVSTARPSNGKGTHVVAPKETLYSIARQYDISVQDLKDWNKIEDNEISIGQELFVATPKPGQTIAPTTTSPAATAASGGAGAVAPAAVAVTAPPKKPATTAGTPATDNKGPVTADSRQATAQSSPSEPREQTIRISESVKSSDEVLETGLAELIDGTEGNRKYLALHRTAPVGTILKVKNEMNDREVFVRVMGKLPDTALTNKLVIKISKSAFDRLGAIDPRFRVEVTYYK